MNASTTPDPKWRAARAQSATLFALVIAVALALAVAVPAAQTVIACNPGPTTINGQPAEIFCGPARATVHVAGQTLHFTGGTCTKAYSELIANIGTEILTRATMQTQPYFAASFPLTPGRKEPKPPTVSWASGSSHGTTALVVLQGPPVKYTLSPSLDSATFQGRHFPGQARFFGSAQLLELTRVTAVPPALDVEACSQCRRRADVGHEAPHRKVLLGSRVPGASGGKGDGPMKA
jgi:hypothetical protein